MTETDFPMQIESLGQNFISENSYFHKCVCCPGGENETYVPTFMFQFFGGLETAPPHQVDTNPENHVQFASVKL